MEYKKVERNTYNINIIKTDRFKSIDLTVFFTNEFEKDSVIKATFLPTLLTSSTKKYKNINDLNIYTEELYGVDISSSFIDFGNLMKLRFSMGFLDPKYTEKSMLKKSLDFFKECLLNPNVDGGEFNKEIFDMAKNSILNKIKSIKDNLNSYADMRLRNEMFAGLPTSFNLYNEYENFEKVSPREIYDLYLGILSSWKIDVFLTGDISTEEEKEYLEEIDKIFSSIKNNFNKKLILFIEEDNPEFKEVVESSDFSQSGIGVGYRFIGLTDYEKKYVSQLYNLILGTVDNSILFTEVREKESLCYSVGSYLVKYPMSLIIYSKINKINYDKAIIKINESVNKMNSRKYISKLFKVAKENIYVGLNYTYDTLSHIVENYYLGMFDFEPDIEKRRKIYKSVKIKDIIKLNKHLNKSIIYYLRGDKE